MTDCEWCGRPLHGAVYCQRPTCTLDPDDRLDLWLSRGALGLCAFTILGVIAQIMRGWPW